MVPIADPIPPNNEPEGYWDPMSLGLSLAFLVLLSVLMSLVINYSAEFTPQRPEFWVDSGAVSMSLLNFTTFSELTATWDLTLLATNPNLIIFDISFSSLQATLLYGELFTDGVMLTTKTLPPPGFLSKQNQTGVSFKLETEGAYVRHNVAKEISQGMARGSVIFKLQLLTWLEYKTDVNTTDVNATELKELLAARMMRFSCGRVEFGFSPDNATGTFTGQSRECKLDQAIYKSSEFL